MNKGPKGEKRYSGKTRLLYFVRVEKRGWGLLRAGLNKICRPCYLG
jgi:hypothetical protein